MSTDKTEHPIDTFKLYAELRDLVAEAGAVDTMIGRPEVLRSRLADLCDRVGRCTNPRLPPVAAPPAQPQSEPTVEWPDDGELEAWRLTADDLLRFPLPAPDKIRRAAHLLQNAYLFASKAALAAQPPERAAQQEPDSKSRVKRIATQMGWTPPAAQQEPQEKP